MFAPTAQLSLHFLLGLHWDLHLLRYLWFDQLLNVTV
jgi:hypothetical protein